MEDKKLIGRFMKRADLEKNRIIIPKFYIDKCGRDFYLDIYDDGTIVIIPIEKLNKKETEE